jgi:hypothetical protein
VVGNHLQNGAGVGCHGHHVRLHVVAHGQAPKNVDHGRCGRVWVVVDVNLDERLPVWRLAVDE